MAPFIGTAIKMRVVGAAMCADRSCFCWKGILFHAEGDPGTEPAYALVPAGAFVPTTEPVPYDLDCSRLIPGG